MKKHVPVRSSDQTKITISLGVDLLARIDAEAEKEDRPRSQIIRRALEKVIAQKEAQQNAAGNAPLASLPSLAPARPSKSGQRKA